MFDNFFKKNVWWILCLCVLKTAWCSGLIGFYKKTGLAFAAKGLNGLAWREFHHRSWRRPSKAITTALRKCFCASFRSVLFIIAGAANCVTGQKKNLLAMAKTWYNQLSLNTLKLMQTNKAISGFHLGYVTDEELFGKTMSKLLELYKQGKIKPRIDSCYHFEEVSVRTVLIFFSNASLHTHGIIIHPLCDEGSIVTEALSVMKWTSVDFL